MVIALILVSVALAVSLFFQLSPPKHAASTASGSSAGAPGEDVATRLSRLESELDKKKKELEEQKAAHAETKEQLKATKKKVFDQKEASKTGDDLVKARADVERQASIQLEATRAELATALQEVQRLKAAVDAKPKARPAPEAPAAPAPQVQIVKQIRELSDADKERMDRLETQAAKDRTKAIELEKELRTVKLRADSNARGSKQAIAEANLAVAKFRAVEVRLNRTLLQNDLLLRAIADLEKKSGNHAERTELTPAEIAESDKSMKEKHLAEDADAAAQQAKLEQAAAEAPASTEATAETPAAPVATA